MKCGGAGYLLPHIPGAHPPAVVSPALSHVRQSPSHVTFRRRGRGRRPKASVWRIPIIRPYPCVAIPYPGVATPYPGVRIPIPSHAPEMRRISAPEIRRPPACVCVQVCARACGPVCFYADPCVCVRVLACARVSASASVSVLCLCLRVSVSVSIG